MRPSGHPGGRFRIFRVASCWRARLDQRHDGPYLSFCLGAYGDPWPDLGWVFSGRARGAGRGASADFRGASGLLGGDCALDRRSVARDKGPGICTPLGRFRAKVASLLYRLQQ